MDYPSQPISTLSVPMAMRTKVMILTVLKCESVQLLPPALEAGEVSSMCSFITRRTRLSLPLYYEMARGIVIALSFAFLFRAQLALSRTEWKGEICRMD